MGFKLRQKHEVFKVVDGPFAGHTYRHGITYEEVPPQEKHKFEQITERSEERGTRKKDKTANFDPQASNLEPQSLENGGE